MKTPVRLISTLLIPLLLHAQAGPPLPTDWRAVESIPPGAKLIVHLSNGRSAKGELARTAPTSLTIFIDNRTEDFARREISRVYRMRAARRARAAAIGAAIGGGIGVGVGGYIYSQGDIVKGAFASFAFLGAGFGALLGALLGSTRKPILVYAAYPTT